jgi:hypothetical protein
MRKAVIISTKDPTELLLSNIDKYKLYYGDFNIIIIDSNSTKTEIFNEIPPDVIIDYAKNNNYVLGAWKYAINKYDYDLYLFVQDSLVPLKRIEELDFIDNFSNIMFDIPYTACISFSELEINLKDFNKLRNIYINSKFSFISNIPSNNIITGCAHTSFLANKETSKKLIELDDVYKEKGINKNKIDCNLSERTLGILADYYNIKRLSMNNYFDKINLGRK